MYIGVAVYVQLVSMFASRACRSAVMVGTALSEPQMTKVCTFLHIHC
jgi:DNA mismatch repair ATPase MutL